MVLDLRGLNGLSGTQSGTWALSTGSFKAVVVATLSVMQPMMLLFANASRWPA